MTVVRRVVVVGAGIVGASVAFHLARSGLRVTVLDRDPPGSGATGRSFAWIGDGDRHTGSAAAVHDAAPREWHRLCAALPGLPVRWSGALAWAEDPSVDRIRGRSLESATVLSSAEVSAVEPNLRRPPERAAWFPGDGAIDPVGVTSALLGAARDHGADVLRAPALAVRQSGGRVAGVATPGGLLPAHHVVLAAGVDVPALCSPLGVILPVSRSPALLARFRAPDDLIRTLVAAPDAELRCAGNGALLAALAYEGQDTPEQLDRTGRRTLRWITSGFSGADDVTLTGVSIGIRPVPADGVPIVGRLGSHPGVHVAVLHPGVQLAPVVGRLVAEEVVHGTDATELRDCSPGRFPAAAPHAT